MSLVSVARVLQLLSTSVRGNGQFLTLYLITLKASSLTITLLKRSLFLVILF